jgi:prevent-host-death family protein
MPTISETELRDDTAAVLRRAHAGERITVAVGGRPVAELGPVRPHRWVSANDARHVWATTATQRSEANRGTLPAALVDPFE